jgi:hypothetical protein
MKYLLSLSSLTVALCAKGSTTVAFECNDVKCANDCVFHDIPLYAFWNTPSDAQVKAAVDCGWDRIKKQCAASLLTGIEEKDEESWEGACTKTVPAVPEDERWDSFSCASHPMVQCGKCCGGSGDITQGACGWNAEDNVCGAAAPDANVTADFDALGLNCVLDCTAGPDYTMLPPTFSTTTASTVTTVTATSVTASSVTTTTATETTATETTATKTTATETKSDTTATDSTTTTTCAYGPCTTTTTTTTRATSSSPAPLLGLELLDTPNGEFVLVEGEKTAVAPVGTLELCQVECAMIDNIQSKGPCVHNVTGKCSPYLLLNESDVLACPATDENGSFADCAQWERFDGAEPSTLENGPGSCTDCSVGFGFGSCSKITFIGFDATFCIPADPDTGECPEDAQGFEKCPSSYDEKKTAESCKNQVDEARQCNPSICMHGTDAQDKRHCYQPETGLCMDYMAGTYTEDNYTDAKCYPNTIDCYFKPRNPCDDCDGGSSGDCFATELFEKLDVRSCSESSSKSVKDNTKPEGCEQSEIQCREGSEACDSRKRPSVPGLCPENKCKQGSAGPCYDPETYDAETGEFMCHQYTSMQPGWAMPPSFDTDDEIVPYVGDRVCSTGLDCSELQKQCPEDYRCRTKAHHHSTGDKFHDASILVDLFMQTQILPTITTVDLDRKGGDDIFVAYCAELNCSYAYLLNKIDTVANDTDDFGRDPSFGQSYSGSYKYDTVDVTPPEISSRSAPLVAMVAIENDGVSNDAVLVPAKSVTPLQVQLVRNVGKQGAVQNSAPSTAFTYESDELNENLAGLAVWSVTDRTGAKGRVRTDYLVVAIGTGAGLVVTKTMKKGGMGEGESMEVPIYVPESVNCNDTVSVRPSGWSKSKDLMANHCNSSSSSVTAVTYTDGVLFVGYGSVIVGYTYTARGMQQIFAHETIDSMEIAQLKPYPFSAVPAAVAVQKGLSTGLHSGDCVDCNCTYTYRREDGSLFCPEELALLQIVSYNDDAKVATLSPVAVDIKEGELQGLTDSDLWSIDDLGVHFGDFDHDGCLEMVLFLFGKVIFTESAVCDAKNSTLIEMTALMLDRGTEKLVYKADASSTSTTATATTISSTNTTATVTTASTLTNPAGVSECLEHDTGLRSDCDNIQPGVKDFYVNQGYKCCSVQNGNTYEHPLCKQCGDDYSRNSTSPTASPTTSPTSAPSPRGLPEAFEDAFCLPAGLEKSLGPKSWGPNGEPIENLGSGSGSDISQPCETYFEESSCSADSCKWENFSCLTDDSLDSPTSLGQIPMCNALNQGDFLDMERVFGPSAKNVKYECCNHYVGNDDRGDRGGYGDRGKYDPNDEYLWCGQCDQTSVSTITMSTVTTASETTMTKTSTAVRDPRTELNHEVPFDQVFMSAGNSKKNQDADDTTLSNVVMGTLFRFRNLVDVPQSLLAQSQMGDFDDDGDEDLMYLEDSNKKLSFLRNRNDGKAGVCRGLEGDSESDGLDLCLP